MRSIFNKIRLWLRGSILRKLWYTYFLVIFITITGITVIVYYISTDALISQTKQYTYDMLEMLSKKIDSTILQLDNISYFIYQDDVQNILNTTPLYSESDQVQINRQLTSRFFSWIGFLHFNIDVNGVYLIKNENIVLEFPVQTMNKNCDFNKEDWYNNARAAVGRFVFLVPEEMDLFLYSQNKRTETFRFGAARWVFNTVEYEPQGILLLDIEIPEIEQMISEIYKDDFSKLLIMDVDGNIIYTTVSDEGGFETFNAQYWKNILKTSNNLSIVQNSNQKEFLVNTFSSENTGWYFITLTDYSRLTGNADKIRFIIIGIGIIGLLFSVIASTIVSRHISIPIKNLKASMENVRHENFSERIPVTELDEIGDLQLTFNEMLSRIEYLIVTVYQKELNEKQALLDALQAQINPHFLYNTLDTINSMAVLNENEEISRMAVALSNMFKYAVKQEQKLVPLKEELANLRDYYEIQKFRFGKRLHIQIDIAEELYGCQVLRLSMQPLVENAIIHGLEPKIEGGTIFIQGKKKDNCLYISVADNGAGLDSIRLSELKKLLAGVTAPQTDQEHKIGLLNVNERLKLFFGDSAKLEFDSILGLGSRCSIYIPL